MMASKDPLAIVYRRQMYTSKIVLTVFALFPSIKAGTTAPHAAALLKRQGLYTWEAEGNDCDVHINACIIRGGDPTLDEDDDNFSTGFGCPKKLQTFISKVAKGINDAGETGYCNITVKIDKNCCVNNRCSVWEVNRNRRVVKTNGAYEEETQGDVHFSKACPKGTYIQSETRLI
ncbi:hypothetical protein HYALB_00011242 [Hymenoscyphus albidus]|uniref:Uncharacterized protein n=1 Tax=Hymenoscyphus albidus TaxID=595503 RepID=A0A9N9LBD0_9HELO|nr:hypothetical protein HYALB_00011242 [Hymenoscyphus albidus]